MTQAPAHPSSAARLADASPSTRHRWLPVGSEGLRYRGGVAVRALAAILGGYGLSALAAAVIAIALPAVRLEAAVAATMLAFVVYPCAVMWVFAARSAARALLGLALPSAVLGAIVAANQYLGATP
ncbi:hypothetical protein [Xylophilus sp. GOD-11R]|uniref:hypothetical protein n=1 Tax=Xylophilus sp. GOD-11R TaxID=3089814 RepID=UPI00399C1E61